MPLAVPLTLNEVRENLSKFSVEWKGASYERGEAQGIIDCRETFPDATLADLYDPTSMPPPLRTAHNTLDAAIFKAIGLHTGASDTEILSRLMTDYAALIATPQQDIQ